MKGPSHHGRRRKLTIHFHELILAIASLFGLIIVHVVAGTEARLRRNLGLDLLADKVTKPARAAG